MQLRKLYLYAVVGLLLAAVVAAGFIEGMVSVRSPVIVAATGNVSLQVQIEYAQFNSGSCTYEQYYSSALFSPEQFKTASSLLNSIPGGVSNTISEASNACSAAVLLCIQIQNEGGECNVQDVYNYNSLNAPKGPIPLSISVTGYLVGVHLSLDNQLPIQILGASGQLEGQKFDVRFGTTFCSTRCSLNTTVALPGPSFPAGPSETPLKPTLSVDIGVPEQWGFPPSLWIRYGTARSTMNVTLEITPTTGDEGLANS
jgi:hypothetical protein